MHLPRFLRRINRAFTNPLLGTFAWLAPPLAVIHHVGRKSGRRYRTPVVAFPSRAGFVIPMTYGRDVDWARNVIAASGCRLVQMGRGSQLSNPRIVGFNAAAPHLPAIARPALRAVNLPGYFLLAREGNRSRPTGKRSQR